MGTKKTGIKKTAPQKRDVRVARVKHNTFSDHESYAMLLLLSTKSRLVMDINDKLADGSVTAAGIVTYFANRLKGTPFNLTGKFDVTYFAPLLLFNGQKRTALDTTVENVAAALELPYDTPPCPPEPTQTQIWTRLVNLQP